MKSSLVFFQFIGFLFTSIAGVLLHYAFDWSGESIFVGYFSSVNESIWEHMKILFVPLLLYALIENHITKHRIENFWCIKLFGTVMGIFLIPMIYYTYTMGLGIKADWLNIATFFIVAAIVFTVETFLFKSSIFPCASQGVALLILMLVSLTFVVFTFYPPELPLFQDPVTGSYGYAESLNL